MIKICISVMSHALDPLPLSQTVTPSRTPYPCSSVTYFMDGPIPELARDTGTPSNLDLNPEVTIIENIFISNEMGAHNYQCTDRIPSLNSTLDKQSQI